MRALRPGRLLLDALLACVVLVISLNSMSHGGWDRDEAAGSERELDGLGTGLALLMALPLAARRLAPIPVLAVVTVATATLYGLDYGFPPVAFAIALYTAARWADDTSPAVRNAVLAGSVVVLLLPSFVRHGLGPELSAGAVVWAVAWLAGDRVRQRHERAATAAERAEQAAREAERERRLASAEERTRIARDLHDSAGHAVSVILVQAGAARLLLESDPAQSRAAIATIEDVARDTLVEIDQLVRALREPASAEAVEPPAGLAALDALIERSRAAGLDVSIVTEGTPRVLSPNVDQAAFRILREALTNVARHGSGRAEVELRYAAAALEIVVSNPIAPSGATDGGGHGLVGMTERALLLGGTLEAGAEGGTFRVRASLPYRDAR